MTVSALYAPVVETGPIRLKATVPVGTTVADIVGQIVPAGARDQVRVVLVDERGSMVVAPGRWARVKPKSGVTVVVRPLPGNNALKSVLQIVVAIAAVALAPYLAPFFTGLGFSAQVATALATIGIGLVGSLLLNALIPPVKRSNDKDYGGYNIGGLRNSAAPDGPIPVPFGRMRYAPPYAAPPYTEISGDDQYIRALFVWGYGRLAISDFKIGDTPITEYDEVQIETREGVAGDDPVTLYPQQVVEEGLSVELTRAWQRADNGDYLAGGHTVEKPIIRYTASDVSEIGVVIGFPGGLLTMSSSGARQSRTVSVRIRQRPVGGSTWSDVTTLNITASRQVPIWRQHRWTVPTRGAYEVELTRMSDESKESSVSDRTVWQALQSYRPEYPIAFDQPLALSAVRIKATAQLNGQLDNLSAIVSRIAPDWDAATGTWITRETRSPAAAMRWALQGPANAFPSTDAELDLGAIADWAEWCASKGLHYDRVHDQVESLQDGLAAICHAGRATADRTSGRWSVVVDRPSDLVVDHINPRNARDFKWSRSYPAEVHGFRIPFQDASNDWKKSERIVPWPGHVGDVILTEQIELPGITEPDQIWIAARRRQYEADLRADKWQVTQDGYARAATRGDRVALSYDVLARTQMAARVVSVDGAAVTVDADLSFDAGVDYGLMFRVISEADTIGVSVVRRLVRQPGTSRIVLLADTGTAPIAGNLVQVGPLGAVSTMARVRQIERGDDTAQILHLIADAPEIDQLTDAEVPPAWDGRVGSTGSGTGATPAPAVPTIVSVATGRTGTGDADGLQILLAPGAGSPAPVASFVIQHRLVGGTSWTSITVAAASAGASIAGYVAGDAVELRAHAVSLYGVASADTPIVTATIGSADPVTAPITSLSATTTSGGLRRYQVGFGSGDHVGYQLRAAAGLGVAWASLTPLHTGTLSISPWETSEPSAAGDYTIGAVAIASDGTAGTPTTINVTF